MEDLANVQRFEDRRKALLQSYDSRTTGHEALIIALAVGALTLISRWDVFKPEFLLRILFYCIFSFLTGLSAYVIARTMVWAYMSHSILGVTSGDVEKWLEEMKDTERKDLEDRELIWIIHRYICSEPERYVQTLRESAREKASKTDWITLWPERIYLEILRRNMSFNLRFILKISELVLGILLVMEGLGLAGII